MLSEEYGRGPVPGELLAKWPRRGDGEPVTPKFLAHRKSVDMADTLLANLLEAYGIPVLLRHPGDGSFGKVLLGMSGTGSNIYVPETMYDQALELMEAECDDSLQSGI